MTSEEKDALIERIQYLIKDTGTMFSILEQMKIAPEYKVLTHNYYVVCMKALLELENVE